MVKMIFLCGALGILLFTFFRMAGKKLGWFLWPSLQRPRLMCEYLLGLLIVV
jgi:hypothetical protein